MKVPNASMDLLTPNCEMHLNDKNIMDGGLSIILSVSVYRKLAYRYT